MINCSNTDLLRFTTPYNANGLTSKIKKKLEIEAQVVSFHVNPLLEQENYLLNFY